MPSKAISVESCTPRKRFKSPCARKVWSMRSSTGSSVSGGTGSSPCRIRLSQGRAWIWKKLWAWWWPRAVGIARCWARQEGAWVHPVRSTV